MLMNIHAYINLKDRRIKVPTPREAWKRGWINREGRQYFLQLAVEYERYVFIFQLKKRQFSPNMIYALIYFSTNLSDSDRIMKNTKIFVSVRDRRGFLWIETKRRRKNERNNGNERMRGIGKKGMRQRVTRVEWNIFLSWEWGRCRGRFSAS